MIDMDYFSFGTGEKVFVILPGVSLRRVLISKEAIKNQFKKIAEDHRVYLFERLNNMPEGYTTRDMARDTAEKMKELGITKASIYGASQGGMLAQYIAIDYPELVESIILGSSYVRPTPSAFKGIENWLTLVRENKIQELSENMMYVLYSQELCRKIAKGFVAFLLEASEEDIQRFRIECEACLTHNAYEEMRNVTCPVHILGSRNDHLIGAEAFSDLEEVSRGKMYLYDAPYEHAVFDEAPDFLDRIYEMLREL